MGGGECRHRPVGHAGADLQPGAGVGSDHAWPNTAPRSNAPPAALLIEAIDSVVSPHVPTSISDSVEEDLVTALSNLHQRMARKQFRAIFAALLDHANRDAKTVVAQRRFVNGVLKPIHDILSAAKERGDLPSGLDIESASARLAGPLFHRHVMLRASISNQLIAQTIDQFLCGFRDAG